MGAGLCGRLGLPETVGRAVLDGFERFDGRGAPDGKAGPQIAAAARFASTTAGTGSSRSSPNPWSITGTRPDGRTFDVPQVLVFTLDGERVRSVEQYIGDHAAVTAFWA